MGSKGVRSRVVCEPDLEEQVALYTPSQRLALASKLRRWARQLEVSAVILRESARVKPKPSLRRLPARKLALN